MDLLYPVSVKRGRPEDDTIFVREGALLTLVVEGWLPADASDPSPDLLELRSDILESLEPASTPWEMPYLEVRTSICDCEGYALVSDLLDTEAELARRGLTAELRLVAEFPDTGSNLDATEPPTDFLDSITDLELIELIPDFLVSISDFAVDGLVPDFFGAVSVLAENEFVGDILSSVSVLAANDVGPDFSDSASKLAETTLFGLVRSICSSSTLVSGGSAKPTVCLDEGAEAVRRLLSDGPPPAVAGTGVAGSDFLAGSENPRLDFG